MLETLAENFPWKMFFAMPKYFPVKRALSGTLDFFFFLFSTRNVKSEKPRVLWIVLLSNRAAVVHQGSCDKTRCVQASGEKAAHVGRGKAVH